VSLGSLNPKFLYNPLIHRAHGFRQRFKVSICVLFFGLMLWLTARREFGLKAKFVGYSSGFSESLSVITLCRKGGMLWNGMMGSGLWVSFSGFSFFFQLDLGNCGNGRVFACHTSSFSML